MNEARVKVDDAGNEKISRAGKRSRGRDDAALSSLMAVAELSRRTSGQEVATAQDYLDLM